MGRDKALLTWPPAGAPGVGEHTFLSSWIRALNPFNDMVIVVAGENFSHLAPVAYANGASIIHNPRPERGQFSSLQTGLNEVLNRGRDAAMITLVDRPPVAAATLQALDEAFAAAIARGLWAVVPEHAGKHGHPIVAGREMIEAFLRAPDTSTAREAEHENQSHIEYVKIDDPFVAMNINTPEDYAQLASLAVPSPK